MSGPPSSGDPSRLAFSVPVMPLLAHGLGDAGDLPVPLPLLLYGSGGVLLALAWWLSRRPQGRPRRDPRPLPAGVTTIVDSPITRGVLRVVGAGVLLAAAIPAAFGAPSGAENPAPRVLFAVLWGGLLFASLLFGPVWRRLNPLRAVSAGVARLSGDPDEVTVRPLPKRLGYWPAAVSLAVLLMLEAVAGDQSLAVLVFLTAHTIVHVGAAAVYGRDWYAHADPFEVTSDLVGRLGLVGRGPDGRVGIAGARDRLAALPVESGLIAVLAVLGAANLFDGVVETGWWRSLRFGFSTAGETLLVLAGFVLLAGALAAAFRLAAGPERILAPALVGVVVAYAWAHYFAVFLIEGQTALAQLSDPFALGWNLFGTAGWYATYELLPGAVAATVRLVGFLAGHLAAVAVGDVIARRAYGTAAAARNVQTGLRAMVVISGLLGIWLLFGG